MTCGIYRIINKTNGKSYIGLSRNIKRRWRQHTWGLDRSDALEHGSYPLRAAFIQDEFLKYPERFEFKVIEECEESLLLERENYWIGCLEPTYNTMVYASENPSRAQDAAPNQRVWIQYHDYDAMGFLPGEAIAYSPQLDQYEDALFGLSTGARAILDAKGDTVFRIVGIGNPKQYYLISQFTIEDVPVCPDLAPGHKEMLYEAYGAGWVLDPPQLLNSNEFEWFKSQCGDFEFGLMSVATLPYVQTLCALSERNKAANLTYTDYVQNFYRSVFATNPKERSALAGKGVAQHLVLSTSAPWAAIVLLGVATKLLILDPVNEVINYRGLLFIHTLPYDLMGDGFQQSYQDFLARCSLDGERLGKEAMQGCVTIKDVYEYTPDAFAADAQAHTYGTDIEQYKASQGLPSSSVWCIEIERPTWLSNAVVTKTPPGIQNGHYWIPRGEAKINAVRIALEDIFREPKRG